MSFRFLYPLLDAGCAASDRIAAPSPPQSFDHEADCVIVFTISTLPASGPILIRFRKQDSSNFWYASATATGSLQIYEYVAGMPAVRGATAAGVLSGGERVVVVCHDETIEGYYDGVQAWTYGSATNFKTAVSGEVNSFGVGGLLSDLAAWPYPCGLSKAGLTLTP